MTLERKSKGDELTKAQKRHNKRLSKERIRVENAIASIKHYRRTSFVYEETFEDFNAEFNVACGLANARLILRNSAYDHRQSVLDGKQGPHDGAGAPPADSPPPVATADIKTCAKKPVSCRDFSVAAVIITNCIFDIFQIILTPRPARGPRYAYRQATNPRKRQELPQYGFIMHACTSFFFDSA